MMSLIWTVVIGFVVGLVARAIKPGDDKLSWLWTIVLGVGGSFLASYLGRAMGWYGQGEAAGFIASVLGAIVLLAIYAFARKKQAG
jgi:uncharacterized membrane protein YeaQ/YmgE (transglycosylase-associated protein family)